jgi:hypothetical protein
MKLSKEQVEIIDASLIKKGIKHLDIKLELIDHISSEVENKIANEAISFENALNFVMKKWQFQFDNSRSFWTGIAITYPKIVLDKMVYDMKKRSIYNFVFMFFALLIYGFYQNRLNETLQPFSNTVDVISVFILTLVVGLIFKNGQEKEYTTYNCFINKSIVVIPIGVLTLLLSKEVVQLKLFNVIVLFYHFCLMLKSFISHRNFIKTIEAK